MPNCVLMSSSCVLPSALRASSADRRLERCTQFEPNVRLPEIAWARQVRQESNREARTAQLLGSLQARSGDPVIQDCVFSTYEPLGLDQEWAGRLGPSWSVNKRMRPAHSLSQGFRGPFRQCSM